MNFKLLVLGLVLFGCASRVSADTIIFSDLPTPASKGGIFNYVLGADGYGQDFVDGAAFTPSSSALLTSAEALLGTDGFCCALNLYIESSQMGEPGAVLADLTQTSTSRVSPLYVLASYSCSLCPMLSADNTYWLVGTTAELYPGQEWGASPDPPGTLAYNTSGSATGPWNIATDTYLPEFSVSGTVVPESASVSLIVGGVLLLGLKLRHTRRT